MTGSDVLSSIALQLTNVRKDTMIQTRDNQYRHTTRQAVAPGFVRAGLPMAVATISWMAVLVACKKEAAP